MATVIDGSAGVTTNAGGSVNPSTNVDGINYSCRAWVNFNGTGAVAIRGSGNVNYITDNGNGDYTVNFTTAMSDANYSLVSTVSTDTTAISIAGVNGNNTVMTTTTAKVIMANISGTAVDRSYVGLAVFR